LPVVVEACAGAPLRDVRTLLKEYWDAFAFDPCFQGFDREIAGLPGDYAPPSGRLALAVNENPTQGPRVAGCIALRRLSKQRCEMKRLYVRDAFRGRGFGLALVRWLLVQARAIGYEEMFLDTMPPMTSAIALYERLGFTRCEHYTNAPQDGALCYRRKL
jgi:ribosomal protein S18 acetylase RimI-like enzyme